MSALASRDGAAPLLRSTSVLIRLRLRRLLNQLNAARLRKKSGDQVRKGNPGKKSGNGIVYLAAPMMLIVFGSIAFSAVVYLHQALDAADTFWVTVEFSTRLAIGLAFLLGMFWSAALLVTIASGELTKSEWDLEWLITLPVRSDTLLWARIAERSIVNPTGVLALLPACTAVAWFSGLRFSAPLFGVLAAWPLLLLGATARTLIDTGLRLRLNAAQLRNLHAVISVLSIALMYLAMSFGMKGKADFMVNIAGSMPAWLLYTPMGLVVRAINERTVVESALLFFALFVETGVICWMGVRLLQHLLRHGVVAGGARDSGRRERPPTAALPIESQPHDRPRMLTMSAVQRRELTLLRRDRNFLVQSLVLPMLIVGGQLLLGTSSAASTMWTNPDVLASVAFGLAAYSLSMSAFQTLNNEGQALWLLYTFPWPIEDVLKDKAKLWGVLTLVYPLLLFTVGALVSPTLDWKFAGAVLTTLLGIPIYAFIAVALGVYGSNPLEQQAGQKVKPVYFYLYSMLAGLYIYAIVTPQPAQRLVFMVLTMTLAAALWQKARDQLGFLLDPDASPPPRVSTSDGLMAAMLFFVVQGIVVALAHGISGREPTGALMLVAFSIGGAVTYALMRYVYASNKTEGVPRIFAPAGNRLLLGVLAGLAAGAIGTSYLASLDALDLLESARRASESYESVGLWILPLALVAAPVFEEFIFRGLIFGGLRRSFGLWPATLASAAIFAIMHPAFSIIPVFCMAVCASLVYERSRTLIAPMVVHAVYNASVIGASTLLV